MAGQLRRERLRREMADEIIGTARLLLEKGGPGAISVRAIARQVGVTTPAIYRYYPSLDALLSALSESVISELCAVVESARDHSGGMAVQFRGWALAHPASFRFALVLLEGSWPSRRLDEERVRLQAAQDPAVELIVLDRHVDRVQADRLEVALDALDGHRAVNAARAVGHVVDIGRVAAQL